MKKLLGECYNLQAGQVQIDFRVRTQLQQAGIRDADLSYSWKVWDDDFHDKKLGLTVAQICLQWALCITPDNKADLFLHGAKGMGKRHIAHVLAKALAIKWGWTAGKLHWPDAVEDLRSFNGGGELDLRPYFDYDILIVSEIDIPDYTLFTIRKLEWLMLHRADKVTIWTCTVPVKNFARHMSTSSRRDERENPDRADKMKAMAQGVLSRFSGQVANIVPFSAEQDWRSVHGLASFTNGH